MSENCGWVIAFKLDSRVQNAPAVQEVLTKHGCLIKARLGLHETSKDYCANFGIIILQCCGCEETIGKLVADLNAIEGVKARSMCLD
jgi:hypothetical protein